MKRLSDLVFTYSSILGLALLMGCDTPTTPTGIVVQAYESLQKNDLTSFRQTLKPRSEAEEKYASLLGFNELRTQLEPYNSFELERSKLLSQQLSDYGTQINEVFEIIVSGHLIQRSPKDEPEYGMGLGWYKVLSTEVKCVTYDNPSLCGRPDPRIPDFSIPNFNTHYFPDTRTWHYYPGYPYDPYYHCSTLQWQECQISKITFLR